MARENETNPYQYLQSSTNELDRQPVPRWLLCAFLFPVFFSWLTFASWYLPQGPGLIPISFESHFGYPTFLKADGYRAQTAYTVSWPNALGSAVLCLCVAIVVARLCHPLLASYSTTVTLGTFLLVTAATAISVFWNRMIGADLYSPDYWYVGATAMLLTAIPAVRSRRYSVGFIIACLFTITMETSRHANDWVGGHSGSEGHLTSTLLRNIQATIQGVTLPLFVYWSATYVANMISRRKNASAIETTVS